MCAGTPNSEFVRERTRLLNAYLKDLLAHPVVLTLRETLDFFCDGRLCPIRTPRRQQSGGSWGVCQGEERVVETKLVMLGDACSGKSSIVKSYVGGGFELLYAKTRTVDLALKEVQAEDSTFVQLQIWDVPGAGRNLNSDRAGHELRNPSTDYFYVNATAAVVVVDASRPSSFAAAELWRADFVSKVGRPAPVFLFANKVGKFVVVRLTGAD